MTKKHLIAFANSVRNINDSYHKTIIINFLLDILPTFNNKFDKTTFVNYINK
jgi:hypothetical protein